VRKNDLIKNEDGSYDKTLLAEIPPLRVCDQDIVYILVSGHPLHFLIYLY